MVYMLYQKLCRHFKDNPSLASCHLFSWQGREERKTLLFARLFFFFKSVSTMSVRTYETVLFVTSLLTYYCSAFTFPTVQCMRHAVLIQLRYEYCYTVPRDVTCPLLSLPPVGAYRFPRQRETPGGRASAYGVALRWIGRSGGDFVTRCGFRSEGGWAYILSESTV